MNDFDPTEWVILPTDEKIDNSDNELLSSIFNYAKRFMTKVQALLIQTPSVMDVIKSSVSESVFIADLTKEQKVMIAEGKFRFLRRKKDNAILATLYDTLSKDFSSNVALKEIKLTPELTNALDRCSAQLQIAQIAEKIDKIQSKVDEIQLGLENDRLAMAYSCYQRFVQTMSIQNLSLKELAILKLIQDAEDSRNVCMLSQKANVSFIMNQPETFFGKLISDTTRKNIECRLNEIRNSLYAINMVSMVEIAAYQYLGEEKAAMVALDYYSKHVKDVFLSKDGLVERFNQLDKSDEYWSKSIGYIMDNLSEITLQITQAPILIPPNETEEKHNE